MESTLPKPDKTRCAQCGLPESPDQALRRRGKCRAAPYCSVECQKSDWQSHKQVCVEYAMVRTLNSTGIYLGEKPPKSKKGEARRTKGQILQDLSVFANSHNGDTLTVSAWNLLELIKDISRARTFFLALTLRRTESSNPRTLYSLVEAEVLPLSALEAVFASLGNFADSSPVSPKSLLARDEEQRKREGGLGSVMVMSIELPKGDSRKPHDAMKELGVHTLQPLGLYKVHKNSLSRLPPLPKEYYMKCLRNSLDGGAYTMEFQPYTPLNS